MPSSWLGMQQLEKLVSGMYLGEIARLVLVDLQQAVGIFDGSVTKIFEQYSLRSVLIQVLHFKIFQLCSVCSRALVAEATRL